MFGALGLSRNIPKFSLRFAPPSRHSPMRHIYPALLNGISSGIRSACIRVLIGLLYTTGLRISEATGLNIGDVDLARNTLFNASEKIHDRFIQPTEENQ
jgi:integrase